MKDIFIQTFMQSSFCKVKKLIFGMTMTCKQLVRYIQKYNEQKVAVLYINNDIVSNYIGYCRSTVLVLSLHKLSFFK
jgi:hypothetical protein